MRGLVNDVCGIYCMKCSNVLSVQEDVWITIHLFYLFSLVSVCIFQSSSKTTYHDTDDISVHIQSVMPTSFNKQVEVMSGRVVGHGKNKRTE